MTQQVETATIVGNITGNGTATLTVTAAGMTNSPKEVSASVLSGDTPAVSSLKMRAALAADADVSAFFFVGGDGVNTVTLTARNAAANDTTMNLAYTNGTCTGLTPDATSDNTTAGVSEITNGYATLAEYKAWVQVRGGSTGTDTGDDAVIEDIIEAVSRYFDRQTGRRFYQDASDTDYYFETNDNYKMGLPDFAGITTVAVDYNNIRAYTDLTASDWEALPDNYSAEGLPITGLAIPPTSAAYLPTYRRGVKVTGKRGWPSVPDDVKDAVLSIAQNVNGTRSGQTSAGKITVTASGVVIRPEDVPAFAQKIIEHYRNPL